MEEEPKIDKMEKNTLLGYNPRKNVDISIEEEQIEISD